MDKISLNNKVILITGVAGFIGSNLAKNLYKIVKNITIVGIDNLNDYYDVNLKQERLEDLSKYKTFKFIKANLQDKNVILNIFKEYQPKIVINLAAQAGVRYSLKNPDSYIESNIIGFFNKRF